MYGWSSLMKSTSSLMRSRKPLWPVPKSSSATLPPSFLPRRIASLSPLVEGLPLGDLENDARDERLVRAFAAFAAVLHVDLVAEGVETPEQAAFLRAVGLTAAECLNKP